MSDLLTHKEAAAFLRKPESWLFNNAERLGIPRYKIGNHYRYSLTKVLAWLEAQAAGNAA